MAGQWPCLLWTAIPLMCSVSTGNITVLHQFKAELTNRYRWIVNASYAMSQLSSICVSPDFSIQYVLTFSAFMPFTFVPFIYIENELKMNGLEEITNSKTYFFTSTDSIFCQKHYMGSLIFVGTLPITSFDHGDSLFTKSRFLRWIVGGLDWDGWMD